MGRLQGKVALISGGARGIGAAMAQLFAQEGAKVVVGDVLVDEGEALAADSNGSIIFQRLDVTSPADWSSIVQRTETAFGKLDICVNNAGVLLFKAVAELEPEEIRRVLDINLYGVILGTQAVVAAMQRNGSGSIINVSSADGLSSANAVSVYCATKWGVRGFTKSAALELGPLNIRVNSLHPGGTYTRMTVEGMMSREDFDGAFKVYPAQRAADPIDIARGALFLASDDAGYCMGTELAVDGGLSAGHYYFGLPGSPGY